MKLTVEIQSQSPIQPDAYRNVEAEVLSQKERTGSVISLHPRTAPPGTFASLDPNLMQIVLDIASSSAWAIALKGVLNIIAKNLDRSSSKVIIKVGDVEIQLPPGTSTDTILAEAEKLIATSRRKAQ